MSNPAPTLNQINAFNATIGTTIDFNIIGGTEVIRSNRIYIYDLSDNSLICTHLYVSTESIHELPPNTDSSIVYESGKSSADFTNNTQYYAQIQTYTDTNGTQGASGLSVAKLFWCLPTPTLTLATIPTTISTTSYNVSATYTPNTSGGATNEIQEFQFNLYSAIGALLQTSGVVLYGDGVDLSYNFSGLEVDSTYYVTLDVTTTQGMNVSAQSDTFTVSIDTPTMGSASVVNNACDGYISVTSNLSSEYSHEQSVDAGEVMSFTTDSPNDIKELQVDFHPVQDGTPWMSSTPDTTPYLFRACPQLGHSYNSKLPTIVGGSVVWNQLVNGGGLPTSRTWNGLTVTNNGDGSLTFAGTAQESAGLDLQSGTYSTVGYKVLLYSGVSGGSWGTYVPLYDYYNQTGMRYNAEASIINITNASMRLRTNVWAGQTINFTIRPQLIDLTAKCTAPIADIAYAKEQAQAGSGIAWLKSYGFISDEYESYDTGTLKSVEATEHVTRGFNQWDEVWELGAIVNGANVPASSAIRSKNYYPILPNTQYYLKCPSSINTWFYDSDKNWVGTTNYSNQVFTTPSNARYFRFGVGSTYGTTYNHDICVNISDPSRNGEYEPYTSHTYPLGNVTLRGIPKVDANDNIYYDGDTYTADGTVTRKYGLVDLGTLTWQNYKNGGFNAVLSLAKNASGTVPPNAIASKALNWQGASVTLTDGMATITGNAIYIVDANFTTDATAFKTAMSGVYLVYELATPTTETADPYTTPMLCDPNGTEEWVTDNGVPVGQSTTYADIYPISGWTGATVEHVGANQWDEEWESGRINSSTGENMSGNGIRSKNFTPVIAGEKYRAVVAGSYAGASSILILYYDADKNYLSYDNKFPITGVNFTIPSGASYLKINLQTSATVTYNHDISINYPSTDYDYHAYNGTTYPVSWQTEAGTVYGGYVDLVTGVLTVTMGTIDLGAQVWSAGGTSDANAKRMFADIPNAKVSVSSSSVPNILCPIYASISPNGTYTKVVGITIDTANSRVFVYDSRYNTASDVSAFKSAMNGIPLVYELATPQTYQLTPHQIQTLVGQNNLWSDTNGEMTIMYQLPITDLLVKRKDVSQVGSQWLTLHSVPITQSSDMDFTFIDFLNQYGKTYQYALVPVLAQDQSGVIVQIEGGYTVSDNVNSIFDGVYIADQTNVERVKAGVGYGNVDMNQNVGTITPIGSKYPIVVTNSQNQYHNGSIRGKIVPNDFYSNGNLSRIDMVNKRDELEQFLTNKRAKIIKDWNGKMWLVMILSNVSCTFDDNYGMGMVEFSADWVEIGDPTTQQDLYEAGLINVGGV